MKPLNFSDLKTISFKDVKYKNIVREVGRRASRAGPADGRFISGSYRGLVFSHPKEVERYTAGTLLIQRNGWQGDGNQMH